MHSCFLFGNLQCGYKHVVSLSVFCVTSSKQVPGSMYKSIVVSTRYKTSCENCPETGCNSGVINFKESNLHVHVYTPNLKISHTFVSTSPIPSHSNLDPASLYDVMADP